MDTIRHQFTRGSGGTFGAFNRGNSGRTNPPFAGGVSKMQSGRTNAPHFGVKKAGQATKKAAPKILKDNRTLEEVRGPTRKIRAGARGRSRVFRDQLAR